MVHRRGAGAGACLLILSACGAAPPEPAPTTPVLTEAPRAAGRIWLRGVEGSAVGNGTRELTNANGKIVVQKFDGHRLELRFLENGQTFPNRFSLNLAAPEGERLTLGRYSPAWQNPRPGEAKLDFGFADCGDGTGRKVGWFEIHELEHDPLTGDLARLALDFEHRCREPLPTSSIGQIRFASDRPVDEARVATALYWREEPVTGKGPHPVERLAPPETWIAIESAALGRVAFLVTGPDGLPWVLGFAEATGKPLARRRYHDGIPKGQTQAGEGRLQIERTDGECPKPTGWFDVKEIAFRPDGTLDRFAAGFGRRCGSGPWPRGEIRWNSSQPLHQDLEAQRTRHLNDEEAP